MSALHKYKINTSELCDAVTVSNFCYGDMMATPVESSAEKDSEYFALRHAMTDQIEELRKYELNLYSIEQPCKSKSQPY